MTTQPPVISAEQVMKLRRLTDAPMMECKKFLQMTHGNIEEAITEMRKAGGAKADKKSDRIAAEGMIVTARSADASMAVMIEINSETDFVARDANFLDFATKVSTAVLNSNASNVDEILALPFDSTMTIEEARQSLVAKIGENIKVRRMQRMQVSGGVVGAYLHGARIGVLVALKNGSETLAKDLAMHIAASKPLVVHSSDVSAEAIATERDIFQAQAKESGKPQEIIEKMIDGRIAKFIAEVSLSGQPFIKDQNKTVGKLLSESGAEVSSFVRYEVAEGIEKKEDNFVEEVMAQVRGS